jgi:hypothetical protein
MIKASRLRSIAEKTGMDPTRDAGILPRPVAGQRGKARAAQPYPTFVGLMLPYRSLCFLYG